MSAYFYASPAAFYHSSKIFLIRATFYALANVLYTEQKTYEK